MTREYDPVAERLIEQAARCAYHAIRMSDDAVTQNTRIIKCGLDVYTLRLSVERRKPEGETEPE